MRILPLSLVAICLLVAPAAVMAGPLNLFEQALAVHIGTGGPLASPLVLGVDDPGYSSALDADGYGQYGWSLTNTTATTWQDVSILYFLDADWDEDGYANEFGAFLGLGLPVGAPADALAPDQWEIDEPGYVFGDIYDNLMDVGSLDNANAIDGVADDVSLAFGWTLASLAPGDAIHLTVLHLTGAPVGLVQSDPAAGTSVYVNAYLQVTRADTGGPDPQPVPEPAGLSVFGAAALLLAGRFARRPQHDGTAVTR